MYAGIVDLYICNCVESNVNAFSMQLPRIVALPAHACFAPVHVRSYRGGSFLRGHLRHVLSTCARHCGVRSNHTKYELKWLCPGQMSVMHMVIGMQDIMVRRAWRAVHRSGRRNVHAARKSSRRCARLPMAAARWTYAHPVITRLTPNL